MRPISRRALAALVVPLLALAACDGDSSPFGPDPSGSLTGAGGSGPAETHEAGHAALSPGSIEASLAPGATTSATVQAELPDAVPRADVLFAFDLTGSMGEELSTLKTNATAIMDAVASDVPDVQFGLVSHEDYAGTFTTSTADGEGCDYTGTYGEDNEEFDDAPYRLDQALTGTTADVASAIDGMSLGFGGDFGEPYARVWAEAWAELEGNAHPTLGPLGWRDGADRILVQFADAVPHGCEYDAAVGQDVSAGPYGADPGRDGTIGTADDPTVAAALEGLDEHGITLISLYSDAALPDQTHPLWDAYAASTGGTNFSINADGTFPDGADPAATISSLITEQASHLDRLALEVCSSDAGFSDWLVAVTPPEVTGVQLPTSESFELELGPPEGTEPGDYAFQLCLNGDGVEFGRVDVSITVTGGEVEAVIDVKPGSDENPINVNKKRGVVPVAILGSADFDVTRVDAPSLRFGPDGAEPAHDLGLPGLGDGHLEDVDGDGFTDLVTHYDAPATGLEPGDTEACLAGSLEDGTAFEGCDEVRVFGTPGRGPR